MTTPASLPPALRWLTMAGPRVKYSPAWRARAGHRRFAEDAPGDPAGAGFADACADARPVVDALPVAVARLHRAAAFDRKRPTVWRADVRVSLPGRGALDVRGVRYRVDWVAPMNRARALSLPAWLERGAGLDDLPGGLALRWRIARAVHAAVALDVGAHAPPVWPMP